MSSVVVPREIARIKSKARRIEWLHWRKMGVRLLWGSVLLKGRMGTQKVRCLFAKK